MPIGVDIGNALLSPITTATDAIVAEGLSSCLNDVSKTQGHCVLCITGEGKIWTRATRDELRRCVDRASQRLFPPVDARWFSNPARWTFAENSCSVDIEVLYTPEMGAGQFSSTGCGGIKPPKLSKPTRAVMQHLGCEWLSQHSGKTTPQNFDVLQECREQRLHRTPHVDPRGICLTAVVVAQTDLVAFIALPASDAVTFTIVGRIPLPSSLASPSRTTSKRSRDQDQLLEPFGPLAKVYAHSVGRNANVRLVEPRLLIEVVAYRVFASHDTQHNLPVVELDDCYPVADPTAEWHSGESHTFCDLCDMIRSSCADALKLHREFFEVPPLTKNTPPSDAAPKVPAGEGEASIKNQTATTVADVARRMLDTTSVRFPKDKKLFRLNEALLKRCHPLGTSGASVRSLAKGSRVDADECSTVEFKARVSDWAVGERVASAASSNKERLRHTLCAMANTFGGYLLLGLSDDGSVAGVDAEGSDLRTTGLCPALFQGGVDVSKLRVVTDNSGDDATASKKSLPAGWWKVSASPGTAPPAASKTTVDITARASTVVTSVMVHSGSAPFYTPSKFATPSMRGAASTLRMPVRVCCQRLGAHLPQHQSDIAGGDLLAEMCMTHNNGGVAPEARAGSDAWSA